MKVIEVILAFPFVVLGFVWDFISTAFNAGRMIQMFRK